MRRLNALLKPRWKIGCLVVILLLAVLWLVLILYAKLGGQWAAESVLPVLPNSTLMSEYTWDTKYYGYVTRLNIYTVPGTLAEVRTRLSQDVPMSPIDNVLKEDDSYYCSLPIYPWGEAEKLWQNEYFLVWMAASFSGVMYPVYSTYEFAPDCFQTCVFESIPSVIYSDLSNAEFDIPEGSVGVSRQICWPTW